MDDESPHLLEVLDVRIGRCLTARAPRQSDPLILLSEALELARKLGIADPRVSFYTNPKRLDRLPPEAQYPTFVYVTSGAEVPEAKQED